MEAESALLCGEGHRYTLLGLALATNIEALNALWRAIHALEGDAAGLAFMAEKGPPATAESNLRQAAVARAAADELRGHARWAQERLDSLPVAPSAVQQPASEPARRA